MERAQSRRARVTRPSRVSVLLRAEGESPWLLCCLQRLPFIPAGSDICRDRVCFRIDLTIPTTCRPGLWHKVWANLLFGEFSGESCRSAAFVERGI